jgi:flagellar biosynthetic protein FlhB
LAEDTPQPDRTEPATPRRLQRAREEGRVPVSREVQNFAGLMAVTLVIASAGAMTISGMVERLATLLGSGDLSRSAGAHVVRLACTAFLWGAAPFVIAALLAGVAASLLQTGFFIHGGTLRPDFSRISPRAGFRRLFGLNGLLDGLKSIAKVAIMALALWYVVQADLPALMLSPRWEPTALLTHILHPVLRMLLATLVVQAAVAGFDLFWVRFRHARQLRMTREDVREEQRETEGDPRLKARLRQIRMQRARKRMLAAVPHATVVVTNPTHYAIALSYDRMRNAAPKIVAKGIDSMATRIREVAQAHSVPLIANPPLAHALYRVELDAEIPAEHYQAVAEIIAYAWRLGNRVRSAIGTTARR